MRVGSFQLSRSPKHHGDAMAGFRRKKIHFNCSSDNRPQEFHPTAPGSQSADGQLRKSLFDPLQHRCTQVEDIHAERKRIARAEAPSIEVRRAQHEGLRRFREPAGQFRLKIDGNRS